MMGSTKLSKIRADLRAAFSKAKMDVQWFDREIKKLEQERPRRKTAVETLRAIRRVVEDPTDEKPPGGKTTTEERVRRSTPSARK
jgi:predicted phage gp36 major capsid-like protein